MEIVVSLNQIKYLKHYLDTPVNSFLLADKDFSSANKGMKKSDIVCAIQKIHRKNKKAIVKVDRLYQQEEIIKLEDYLAYLNAADCDCVLFSDMAVDQIKKEKKFSFETIYAPETLLTNRYEIKELKNDGIDSVVISKDIPLTNALQIADDSPNYAFLRIHGPILMSYSMRRFISVYTNEKKEYLEGYSLSEENRSLKMPIVEKKAGTWFYHSCLESTDAIEQIMASKLKGVIIDNNLYDDDYTLNVLKIYRDALSDHKSKKEELMILNPNISYTNIAEIRLTQLEKE